LLSLAEICNESLLIQSSIKVSRSTFLIASPGDKHISELGSFQKHLKALHKSLNDGTFPLEIEFILIKFSKEPIIPGESFGNFLLSLMPERKGKIIFIRIIEAIL
jgi:hypothetical protein